MIKACFVHSRGFLSGNTSAKIPELTTSWCSISRTVRTNAFVDHGGLPLPAAIHWSRSSLRTPALGYMVSWQPFKMIWITLHPTACCFVFVLLPVLQTIFKCSSWVIFLVASLAGSWWTNWCLRSCCVLTIDVLDEGPANRLDLDPLGPGWGGCVSMIFWCGIGEEDDKEKNWEVLRII